MIDATNLKKKDYIKLVKKVYELSRPQGLGILHFQEGDTLTDEEAEFYIDRNSVDNEDILYFFVNMDYVKGRACKFNTLFRDGKVCFSDTWYDHTNEQYDELLSSVGLNREGQKEHGCACNCEDCRSKRGDGPYNAMDVFAK